MVLLVHVHLPAQNDYSLQFDGSNDYVTCGIPTGYSFTDMTVMCWMKTVAAPGTYQAVISKDCPGCGSDFAILVHYFDTGDVSFNGEGLAEIAGGIINDGDWHHVAGTRNGTSGLMNLYVDGALVDFTFGGTGTISNTNELFFGLYVPSNPHYYEGWIDEVSIWTRELSQTEVQHYMSNCPEGDETGLLGYWNMEEGTGTVTADLTPNGNDGTLTNGVLWSTDVPNTCLGLQVDIVNADLYIKNLSKGIIMKSENGACWRITINNDGTINIVTVVCPD